VTGPRPDLPGWPDYATALDALHRARDAVVRAEGGARSRRAAHEQAVHQLAVALADQGERLSTLADDVHAPLPPDARAPLPGAPPLPRDAAEADARERVRVADEALAEARRIAGLPQFIPEWSSQLARAAVIYLVLAVPAVLMVVLTFRVKDNGWLMLWFVVVWPLVAAIAGAALLARVSRPRIPPDATESLARRLRPPRNHPWLGFLFSVAAAYLTQLVLEALFGPT
jgi:hypothetical protein